MGPRGCYALRQLRLDTVQKVTVASACGKPQPVPATFARAFNQVADIKIKPLLGEYGAIMHGIRIFLQFLNTGWNQL